MPPVDGDILTIDQVKAHLDIQDVPEDSAEAVALNVQVNQQISDLIEEAEARLQGYIGTRLLAAARTHRFRGGQAYVQLPAWPVSTTDPFTVTDVDTGADVSVSAFHLDTYYGRLEYGLRTAWPQDRVYDVTFTGGLSLAPDWEEVIRPELRTSVRDYVAYIYERRNPGVRREGEGGGLAQTFVDEAIPPRIKAVWDGYRPIIV